MEPEKPTGVVVHTVQDSTSPDIKPGDPIVVFCSRHKLDSNRLLTHEVIACTDFMSCLEYLSRAWAQLETKITEFKRQSSWIQHGSRYTSVTKTANDALFHTVQKLDELSRIQLSTSTSLDNAFLLNAQKKRDSLMGCIFTMSKANEAVDEA